MSSSSASCHVSYSLQLARASTDTVSGSYDGDAAHSGSAGYTTVGVAISNLSAAAFGSAINGVVSRTFLAGGPGNLSQESASIAWGDGSVTRGTLSIPPGNPAELDIAAAHTYWTPGTTTATVTLTDSQTGLTRHIALDGVVASRYVGMGDSYSSGEGSGWPPTQSAPNFAGCDWPLYHDPQGSPQDTDHINDAATTEQTGCVQPPAPIGNVCHRAPTAFDHVLDTLLTRGGLTGVTLNPVACSGGVVNNAYLDGNTVFGDQEHSGESPQLDWLGTGTSLVTLTMGGNNLGFAGIAATCVSATVQFSDSTPCVAQDQTGLNRLGYNTDPGTTQDGSFNLHQQPLTATGLNDQQLLALADHLNGQGACEQAHCFPPTPPNKGQGNLHDDLVLLFRAIKARAPGARILVLGYPRWFSTAPTDSNCEHFTPFDQTWLNDRIRLADSLISDAVSESGVAEYVDVYTVLSGHELCTGTSDYQVDPSTYTVSGCADPGAWLNGVNLVNGFFGSPELMHPKPCAHLAEGQLAADAYSFGDPNTADQYSLGPGAAHTTNDISVPSGTHRLDVSAKWRWGNETFTLTDPHGNTYCNPTLGQTAYCPVQTGSVYSVWTIWNPPAGVWKLTATNQTSGDSGAIPTTVAYGTDNLPSLPPAGVVSIKSRVCSPDGICTYQLTATVAKKLAGTVKGYSWFDDTGKIPLGTGATITLNKLPVILKTTGIAGGYRLTVGG